MRSPASAFSTLHGPPKQPLEGACEGVMACSTCHVIVDKADFERLPERATRKKTCSIWRRMRHGHRGLPARSS